MKAWERIRDVIDDRQPMETLARPGGDIERGKISDASASPQSRPGPPQSWGSANSAPALKSPRRRRLPGRGEIDVHVRIPARLRQRLQDRRQQLGTSLTGTILELVRRGLEEPPPGLQNLHRRDVREGLVEEAVIATLLAVEQIRLELEIAVPGAVSDDETTLSHQAAMAAEQRLLVARVALGDMER